MAEIQQVFLVLSVVLVIAMMYFLTHVYRNLIRKRNEDEHSIE